MITRFSLVIGLALLAALFATSATRADGPVTEGIVGAGSAHTCALTASGVVDCWGNNDYGEATDPPGPYTQVSASAYHNCALTSSGAIHCWGFNPFGQANDPPGHPATDAAGDAVREIADSLEECPRLTHKHPQPSNGAVRRPPVGKSV